MPQPTTTPAGKALALSGGGFRSTLFQIGTLTRMNELGLLPTLSCISSVSGGSIANGFLAKQWMSLSFNAIGVATNFATNFSGPLMEFCRHEIDIKDGLIGILLPGEHAGDMLTRSLAGLLSDQSLQTLPKASPGQVPRFLFNATSLQTGARFGLSREDAGDYHIGFVDAPVISLARAVAASTAFPPVFCPVAIDVSRCIFAPLPPRPNGKAVSDWFDPNVPPDEPADPNRAATVEALHTTAYLADGGMYDNMGLEAVEDRHATVWVSDASAPLLTMTTASYDWLVEVPRIIDVISQSGLAYRRQILIERFQRAKQDATQFPNGAYWSLGTEISDYGTPGSLLCNRNKTVKLQQIHTRLAPFEPGQAEQLVNFGYALADAALRWHTQADLPAAAWPFPAYKLD